MWKGVVCNYHHTSNPYAQNTRNGWAREQPVAAEIINKTNKRQLEFCWHANRKNAHENFNLPTRTLAAGLSTPMAFRIVAPSLVTWTVSLLELLCRILSFKGNKQKVCFTMFPKSTAAPSLLFSCNNGF